MSSVPRLGGADEMRKLSERARAQRHRIVDAAEKCFVESGFHAASIADIAATAGMSPGLIYRYFTNKNAIVKALIERCLEEEVSKIIDRLESPDDVVRAILETFERWHRRDSIKMNPVLLLETTAESTRDVEMAEAVHAASDFISKRLEELIRRTAKVNGIVLSASAVRGRTMILQGLIEGLAVRAIRQPEVDRAAFKTALKEVVYTLMKG